LRLTALSSLPVLLSWSFRAGLSVRKRDKMSLLSGATSHARLSPLTRAC
jgi:hypothetical protein